MHFRRQSFFFVRSLYFAANSSAGAGCVNHGSPLIGFSAFKLIGGQPKRMTKMRPPVGEVPRLRPAKTARPITEKRSALRGGQQLVEAEMKLAQLSAVVAGADRDDARPGSRPQRGGHRGADGRLVDAVDHHFQRVIRFR